MPSILDRFAGSTKPRSGHNTSNTGHSKSSSRHRESENPAQKTRSSHSKRHPDQTVFECDVQDPNSSTETSQSGHQNKVVQHRGNTSSPPEPLDAPKKKGRKKSSNGSRSHAKSGQDHDKHQEAEKGKNHTTPSDKKHRRGHKSDDRAHRKESNTCRDPTISLATATTLPDESQAVTAIRCGAMRTVRDGAPGKEWAQIMGLYALFFESENPLEVKANEALAKNYGLSWTAWRPMKLNSRHSSLEVIDGEETAICRFLSVRADNTKDLLIQTWLWQAAMPFHHQSSREGRLQTFPRSSEGCSRRFKHYDTWLRFCNLINTISLDGYVVVALSDNKSKIPQVVGAIEIEADKLAELEHYQKCFKEKLLKSDRCAPVWCLRDFAVQDGLQFEALESNLMECFTQPAEKEPVARVTFMHFRNEMTWWEHYGFHCRVYEQDFCYATWSARRVIKSGGALPLSYAPSGLAESTSDGTYVMRFLEGPDDTRHYLDSGPGHALVKSTLEVDDDIPIRAGDVYVLETSDPEKYPLPCWDLLNLHYHIQKVTYNFKARGAQESLSGGPPPDVDGDVLRARKMQSPSTNLWADDVLEAVRDEVISEEDGWKWVIGLEELEEERQLRRRHELAELMEDLEEGEFEDTD
ncbi:hypothetical protein PG997_005426 [Apiospora hydei]|uniref:HNH nuclease domain-containing protein n=1 Tax=Apiospora hydei TaxID=1337664 RepID=A0ABR1X4W2_9PEZI